MQKNDDDNAMQSVCVYLSWEFLKQNIHTKSEQKENKIERRKKISLTLKAKSVSSLSYTSIQNPTRVCVHFQGNNAAQDLTELRLKRLLPKLVLCLQFKLLQKF